MSEYKWWCVTHDVYHHTCRDINCFESEPIIPGLHEHPYSRKHYTLNPTIILHHVHSGECIAVVDMPMPLLLFKSRHVSKKWAAEKYPRCSRMNIMFHHVQTNNQLSDKDREILRDWAFLMHDSLNYPIHNMLFDTRQVSCDTETLHPCFQKCFGTFYDTMFKEDITKTINTDMKKWFYTKVYRALENCHSNEIVTYMNHFDIQLPISSTPDAVKCAVDNKTQYTKKS